MSGVLISRCMSSFTVGLVQAAVTEVTPSCKILQGLCSVELPWAVTNTWSTASRSGLHSAIKVWTYWSEPTEGPQR